MQGHQHCDAFAMLRKIFKTAKKGKVRGWRGKFYNDVLHNFYFSSKKVNVNKYKTSLETHKKSDYLVNLHIKYSTMLEWTLENTYEIELFFSKSLDWVKWQTRKRL